MSFSDAIQHVRKCRYFIQPNDGFKRQLLAFNRELIAKRKAQNADGTPKEEVKVETQISDKTGG